MSLKQRLPILLLTLGSLLGPTQTYAGLISQTALTEQAQSEQLAPGPDLSTLEDEVAAHIRHAQAALAQIQSQAQQAVQLAAAEGDMARLYHAYELYDAAEQHYRRAIELQPMNFDWHYYLGRLQQSKGDFEQADLSFSYALALEPDSTLALIRRGDVFLMLNRLEDAKANYLQAFYRHPRSNVLIERLGEVALGEKHYELALEYLLPAVQNQPQANRIHYFIGLAYRGLKQNQQARSHMAQSGPVGVEPPDPYEASLKEMVKGERLYLLRGKMAFNAGQYQAAAEAFEKAAQAAPDSARAQVNLGTALSALGRREAAVTAFRRALEIDPGQATASYNLGMLLIEQDPDNALKLLQNTVAHAPQDADAHLAIARLQKTRGEPALALEHYKQAAVHNPMLEDAWLEGAQLLLDQQQPGQGLAILKQGYRNLPNSGMLALTLANQLAASDNPELRDGKQALMLAETVFRARPGPHQAQVLAMALAETGDCLKAAELQEQLLRKVRETQPDNAPLLGRLERQLTHYQSGSSCRPGISVTPE